MSTDAGSTSAVTSIAPMLSVRDGARAVAFYRSAFGASEVYRTEDPSGSVVSRLFVDGTQFWVSDESPEHGNPSPESIGGATARMILTVVIPMRCSQGRSRPASGRPSRWRRRTGGAWAAWPTRSAITGRSATRSHRKSPAIDVPLRWPIPTYRSLGHIGRVAQAAIEPVGSQSQQQ